MPPLYLHGLPMSSDDWVELLERTGGLAPDLPGFGRTGKGGQLDLTLHGLAAFVAELLRRTSTPRVALVAHDWGAAVALTFAAAHPEAVSRIALLNPLCPIPELKWFGSARLFRTRAVGELAMGAVTRRMLARSIRRSGTRPDAFPDARIATIWDQFDQGTQRAVLRLHRSIDGELMDEVAVQRVVAPVLVQSGDLDAWLPEAPVELLVERLPDATLHRIPDAGHWPWLDDPAVSERLLAFLGRP